MLVLSGFWASSQTARGKKPLPREMTNDLNAHERTLEIQTQTITPRNINMNNNTHSDKEKQQTPLKPENTLIGCEVTAQENR